MTKADQKKYVVFAPEIHLPLIEGVQKSAWSIIDLLSRGGASIDVYSQKTFGVDFEKKADGVRIHYSICAYRVRMVKYVRWVYDAMVLRREIERLNPSCIIVFSLDWSFLLPLVFLPKALKKVTNIVIFSTRELSFSRKLLLRIFGNKFGYIYASSQYILKKVEDFGVSEGHTVFCPTFFTRQKYPQRQRGLNGGYVLYLSSAERSAGIYDVLFAAKILPQVNFVLAIRDFGVRGASDFEKLLSFINIYNINNVQVKRNLPSMSEAFLGARCVVMPPTHNDASMALPLVLLEAFEHMVPVIVSELDIFREHADAGNVLTYSSPEDLAQKIVQVENVEESSRITTSARVYVDSLKNREDAARDYSKIYGT